MTGVLIVVLALLVVLAVGLLIARGRRGGDAVGGRRRGRIGGFLSFLATAVIANAFVIGNEGDLGAGGGDAGSSGHAGSGPA
jgi:hypothetical protein